jgi:magnesium transporter
VPRGARWIDLLDPTEDEILAASPVALHRGALAQLAARPDENLQARPRFESHGAYVFGVLLVAVVVEADDRVYYQEVDLVLTQDAVLSVRKTPPAGEPFDLAAVREACEAHGDPSTGYVAYYIVDAIAERHLVMVDALDDEIDELEDGIEEWPGDTIRRRLNELRHDVIEIRRTLGPTRDAVRKIIDGRVELEHGSIFDRDLRLSFADAYDRLLRASELLDVSRELLAGAREYYQARIAQEQNEVVKKLTAIASILLLPTFIVGVYGQNFDHMPELHWQYGYAWSWGLIAASTIAQLVYFRWKHWI